ncbi:MAG: DUF262 domain-containing protein [Lachnospiraceae bacterium]
MAKPRKQTYTMEMYLEKIKDKDIRNDSDTQRQFVWNNEQVNGLIATVLTEDYIPPIILGEESSSQLWIVDGGQRSGAFRKFRYGNYKITSAIEDSVIHYRAKVRDERGRAVTDCGGNILWEDAVFDIKNKTYDQLPDELKKKFNEYQVETVIHEHCDTHRVSQLIKRYNNHTSMNTSQKAFTYIDRYAREIRGIIDRGFFVNCSDFKEKEKNKGVLERVVVETVMCMYHFDNWKKQTKAICSFLNENASKEEFEKLDENLQRLEAVIIDDVKDVFTSKESFIWLTLFHRFTGMKEADTVFINFIRDFKTHLRAGKRNEKNQLFDEIDKSKGTKDKIVVAAKLDMLTALLKEYMK